jgi:hypothetical protein
MQKVIQQIVYFLEIIDWNKVILPRLALQLDFLNEPFWKE